jgi:murein DD-endopeptidase MepM/ murein hydrolase activator NlpD
MKRFPSRAALAALLWCAGASAVCAVTPEEERLLGCGCDDTQQRDYMPFTRTYSATGTVRGPLAEAAVEAGVPAAAMVEAIEALGAGIDLKRELRDGDRFYVRYERTFTAVGDPIGIGRVLWAELQTQAKGKVSIHRFRQGRSVGDRFWLSTGENTLPASIRMPLDSILVSSGFGMRADPFDQPTRGGPAQMPASFPVTNKPPAVVRPPGAPPRTVANVKPAGGPPPQASPLTNPAGNVNVATPLGMQLGLAPQPAPASAARKFSGFSGPMVMHEGVDLAADLGTPIRAAGDGVVTGAEAKGGYGNWIEIEHEPGAPGAKAPKLATVYGHLSKFAPGIKPGTRVHQGDVIGYVGSTGRSTGPHLHFEILQNGRPTNPMISLALRREQLKGGELLRFRKQVARELQEREREAGSI